MRTSFFLPFFVFLYAILSFSPADANIFNAQEFTLKNGMRVVLIENHKVPVVSHMLWYKVGAADEDWGKSGIAHFFEHLMFKGTKEIPTGEFSRIVQKNGGNDNAFTTQDYTAYYQNIAKKHLPMMMKMEADRMQNLILTDEAVFTERDVILEERRQRTDNSPSALLRESLHSALFVNHPYSNPVIGWQHEIAALNPEDARHFYKRHYRPENAILVVAGDIGLSELHDMSSEIYGKIENPKEPLKGAIYNKPAPLISNIKITLEDKRVGSKTVQHLYRADKGSEALEVLSHILGEGTTSRLYQDLVLTQKIATNVGTYYNSIKKNISVFSIYGAAIPNGNLNIIESSISKNIQKIIKEGVTELELKEAKSRMINSAIYARDSLQGPAMIFGRALSSGFEIDYIENWQSRIDKISQKDVLEAAQKLFAQKFVAGYLRPLKKQNKEVEDAPKN